MLTSRILLTILVFLPYMSFAQSYLNGRFTKGTYQNQGMRFVAYQFDRTATTNGRIKAKYFAQNAYKRFQTWKSGKKILITSSGAFSETWEVDSAPHGLCVDNGNLVNRNVHISQDENGNSLDGLVIVYGGGGDEGGIAVKDIKHGQITTGSGNSYDIKNSSSDRLNFIDWCETNHATVFQLPLMYTSDHGRVFSNNLTYGNQKERRFLAICRGKNDKIYHLIIDVQSDVYMNQAADVLLDWLGTYYAKIYGLLVLDTGGKNILYELMSGGAVSMADVDMSEATNLLVYYYED